MKKKIPLIAILIVLAICLANKDEIKKMFNRDAPAVCAVCEGECPCPDVDCICDGECECEVCNEGEQIDTMSTTLLDRTGRPQYLLDHREPLKELI